MNMKTRLKRAMIGGVALALMVGTQAFGQQSSDVDVTVGTVNGQRSLQVTGATGGGTPSVGGPVQLGFGNMSTSAPFGTVVTDLLYKEVGYHVYAELSDLFPIQGDGNIDCTASSIPAGAFDVSGVTQLDSTDIDAVLETFLNFTDADDITDNLTDDVSAALDLLGEDLAGTTIEVNNIPGLLESVRDNFDATVTSVLDGLEFMDRDQRAATGGAFSSQDAHPSCGGGAADPSKRYLQHAQANSPDLTALTTAILTKASEGATAGTDLAVSEAVASGLLPPGSTSSGTLYDAVESAVEQALLDAGLGNLSLLNALGIDPDLLSTDLNVIVGNVIDDLVATTGDLTVSLVGQTGVYPSVQTLNLDRTNTAVADAQTGIYHGVMTVTLIDDPDNDSDPTTPTAP